MRVLIVGGGNVGTYIANSGTGCKPNVYCTVKLTPGCP